jgi:SAM-dependent methyltransferase
MTDPKCRIDGGEVDELFSLGEMYVSNFMRPDEKSEDFQRGDLTLTIGKKSKLVQLAKSVDLDVMYRKYWYNSGTNTSMTNELNNIVETCLNHIDWKEGDQWLDIGCNDGTLLNSVPISMRTVGIDPSSSALKAKYVADRLIPDYFNYEAVKDEGKFKFITAIAMFYDLDKPLEFLQDIHKALDDEGLFVVQMSYLPLMIRQLAFDNICHEHLTYYSLEILRPLFEEAGLTIRDCEINDTNGGSFRVFAQKTSASLKSFHTAPFRDVANFRIDSILELETWLNLDTKQTYDMFYYDLLRLREDVTSMIDEVRAAGKTVWGYGASTKGNTLLQFFGLDHTKIDGIAERQKIKYGLRTVGTEIPIYSEAEMRKAKPDYLLMLPWHFVHEFTSRESSFLREGGRFIVPCPKLEII